ncbi:tetratricopeptide repeat protein [Sandarakinorhabdus sp.]|uniref:tetratricopeptide repeat protein n=1 Tax=Sandarakinorhabdus sp. TaxID=1916663 RepID=UPI0033425B35
MANTPAEPDNAPDNAFVREVDEEYRRAQLIGLWRRFGRLGVAALLLGLAGLAGWLFWQDEQAKAAGVAGASLSRAMEQLEVGDGARARPVLDAMTRDGPGAYAGLARMVLANDALAGGDKAKARGLYEAVANDAALPQPLRDAALIKAVRTGFDQMRPADVVAKLKPLAVPGNAWFGVAGELVAVAHMRAGQAEAAKPILVALVKDEQASPSLRTRAAQLAIAAGVDISSLGLPSETDDGARPPAAGTPQGGQAE